MLGLLSFVPRPFHGFFVCNIGKINMARPVYEARPAQVCIPPLKNMRRPGDKATYPQKQLNNFEGTRLKGAFL